MSLYNKRTLTDFKVIDNVEVPEFNGVPRPTVILKKQQELNCLLIESVAALLKRSDPCAPGNLKLHHKPWDKQITSNDNILYGVRKGASFNWNSNMLESSDMHHLKTLASQCPGFASKTPPEMYCANGGDLNLTIDILTQLDASSQRCYKSESHIKSIVSSKVLNAHEFPALIVVDGPTRCLSLPIFSERKN